jgi:hypothetical protein
MPKTKEKEENPDIFGLCATYFICTGIGFKAQEKCEYFKKRQVNKKSTCKFAVEMIKGRRECSNKECQSLAYDHFNELHHEAEMKETFLVRSIKYAKVIKELKKEIADLKK